MYDAAVQNLATTGSIGVVPTDTVYGVVARASDELAVARLYRLKHRERKPGTIIAASVADLVKLGIKARYLKAVEQFWPGAVSVVVPCHDLQYLHDGTGSLAVRIPGDATIRSMLNKTGPLLTSSANDPGQPTAVTVDAAKQYFGSNVDFYVDGGDLTGRLPSTIIRVVDDAIEVLRAGAVAIKENQ